MFDAVVYGFLYYPYNVYPDIDFKIQGTAPTHKILSHQRALPTGSFSPTWLTATNGIVYFSANDGESNAGLELWRSDGTTEGTWMVKDIKSGQGTSSNPSYLTNVDGILYFIADDYATGRELWKSDGISEGTMLVKDIRPGIPGSEGRDLTAIGNLLYFSAFNGTNGQEIWRSDGKYTGLFLMYCALPRGYTLLINRADKSGQFYIEVNRIYCKK